MRGLRLASFGIRGFVGESLTPRAAIDFASAFGTFCEGGRVLLGVDTRASSPMLKAGVLAGLQATGCTVTDYGVCPTPMLQVEVPRLGAAGAVSISGVHNPLGWNTVNLIGRDGAFLNPVGGEQVMDQYHAGNFLRPDWQGMGAVETAPDFAPGYFDALAAFLDTQAIRRARFSVVADPAGGSGCAFLPAFAERLGLDLLAVNGEPTGFPARDPEPRPRNARHLTSIVTKLRAHAGFVLSSDLGRVSVVSEAGEPASEEYTFPLIASHLLARRRGPLVTNICTTRTVDAVAAAAGVPVVKTAVGQAHISAGIADHGAVIGGEGNGSVCVPGFSRAFDGFLMMGLILEAMAVSGRSLSGLIGALPRYHIIKHAVETPATAAYGALGRLEAGMRRLFAGAAVDDTDGLRFDWPDGWVHVRMSRTEQKLRVFSEADTPALAEHRLDRTLALLDTPET